MRVCRACPEVGGFESQQDEADVRVEGAGGEI